MTEILRMTISQLAAQASDYFTRGTKSIDGTETNYVMCRSDTPEWVRDLVREAHGEFMPDDWRYEAIENALDKIAEVEVESDEDLFDADAEYADDQVDIYTHARLKWLASNLLRPDYCDQAQQDGLVTADTCLIDRIGVGQYVEAQEIFASVVRSLTARLEETAVEA